MFEFRHVLILSLQSGKLLWVVNDAHVGGVSALAACNNPELMVSGGVDGQVRIWRVSNESRVMLGSMKEHKGTVTCIRCDFVAG